MDGSCIRSLRERGPSAATRVRVSRLAGARLIRCACLILLLFAISAPASADYFAALVGGLAGDTFAEKEKAVAALGVLGNPRAIPILQALADRRLFKSDEGRIVISTSEGGTTRLRDAVTEADIPDPGQPGLRLVIVNNRLRGAIEGALGALTLFSNDPAARLAAAQDALRHPSAEEAALLEKAIAAEQDPYIRAAMP